MKERGDPDNDPFGSDKADGSLLLAKIEVLAAKKRRQLNNTSLSS
jgi:hypothetical protein